MGFDALWRNDGERYLGMETFSRGSKVTTAIYTASGSRKGDLSFNTLPEKCVFSKKNPAVVYCGMPKNFEQELLPDSWWQGKISFNDEICKINTDTGEYVGREQN